MSDLENNATPQQNASKSQIPLSLIRTVSSTSIRDAVNVADIEKQLDIERADNGGDTSERSSSRTSQDVVENPAAFATSDKTKTIVSFSRNDPLNPYNWPKSRKLYVTIAGILLVMNSTIGSSIATGASSQTAEQFNITDQTQLVLPTSIYLVGYVLGPLFFSPLSETYGRKIIMIATFALYTAFTLGCALAPTWAGLIVMRFLVGVGASTPISIIGGIYSDVWGTPKARGRAMALFMGATTWGPILGPVLSGYIAVVSWRWAYWLQLIIAGATWPVLIMLPETYAPIVLKVKAKKLRKEGQTNAYAPTELKKRDLRELFVVVLTRPVRMFLFEGIVLCSCLYTALVYAIFYSTCGFRTPRPKHGSEN
jgi:multidrug resistance protein